MKYRFSINLDEVSSQVGKTVDALRERVTAEVQALSISTHAFVIKKAQAELPDYLLTEFLGKDNKNVRWTKVADKIWAVEIDESVGWIETEGRPKQFMSWLVDPSKNKKAKRARDGSFYAFIPFSHAKGAVSKQNDPKTAYESIVRNTLKANKISLTKIERNQDGSPKIGVLHTVAMNPPGTQSQFPTMFSAPRTPEMAKLTGLQAHEGIYHLQGLAVVQSLNKKGKPVREALTFRTISSKSAQEGNRWMAPSIQPLNSLRAAQKYAEDSWSQILEAIKRDFQ